MSHDYYYLLFSGDLITLMYFRLFARISRLSWTLVCLSLLLSVSNGSKLGPRSFVSLSTEQLSSIVSLKDPLRNLDPYNPSSHLAKILIPRPGMSNQFTKIYLTPIHPSRFREQHAREGIHHLDAQGLELAHRRRLVYGQHALRSETIHQRHCNQRSRSNSSGDSGRPL